MTKRWACGAPGCEKSLAWHARRAECLEETEGPRAVLEFEMDHPDSEEDEDALEPVRWPGGHDEPTPAWDR